VPSQLTARIFEDVGPTRPTGTSLGLSGPSGPVAARVVSGQLELYAGNEAVSSPPSALPLANLPHPSGNRNEVFSGGYQTFKDFPAIT
jgi:hypothetical protein